MVAIRVGMLAAVYASVTLNATSVCAQTRASATLSVLKPLELRLGDSTVTSRDSVLKLGVLSEHEEAAIELQVSNPTQAAIVVDAFAIGPEASVAWKDGVSVKLLESLSTRVSIARQSSATLSIRMLPQTVVSRVAFPLVVLANNSSVFNAITIMFDTEPRVRTFTTPPQEVTSGNGRDWAYYRLCTPPPPPGYKVVPENSGPTLTGSDRGCQSWGSCSPDQAQDGEGLCYRFGVQGKEKDSATGNDKTVRVNIGINVTWERVSTAARLLDLQALKEAAK
jgi:hypothetical protein